MSQFFAIHPDTPQPRLIRRAAELVTAGGLIVYPTDSCYALGCLMGDKAAMARIRVIRQASAEHLFTLVCRDLSELGVYARVDSTAFRLLKRSTPGPYTFVLRATSEVPRRLQTPKRRTIGLRVPEHAITQALLAELGQPLMSSTLILPGEPLPMTEPQAMRERLEHEVELVIDGGFCGVEPTTIVDLVDDVPAVLRRGKGDTSWLDAS